MASWRYHGGDGTTGTAVAGTWRRVLMADSNTCHESGSHLRIWKGYVAPLPDSPVWVAFWVGSILSLGVWEAILGSGSKKELVEVIHC